MKSMIAKKLFKHYFFLLVFLFFGLCPETSTAQEQIYSKATNIEIFASTRGYFIAPSFSFYKKKHHPSFGLFLGKHHTLGANGFGLNIGDRFYPNFQEDKFNLFFISSLQLIAFTQTTSPSIKNIYNLQLSGGYGLDYQFHSKWNLFTYFSLGFLIENRTFVQNIEPAYTLDSAGILSLGLTYRLP